MLLQIIPCGFHQHFLFGLGYADTQFNTNIPTKFAFKNPAPNLKLSTFNKDEQLILRMNGLIDAKDARNFAKYFELINQKRFDKIIFNDVKEMPDNKYYTLEDGEDVTNSILNLKKKTK